ncbi:hypothetical protein PR001_g28925 [Phytophthora rubi]|uniref:Uncharacterized protein n=1 Tax=Phytophthora rubi TaxID=129364 RepID=A0A6A3H790_9STRA|nr:hypothetical protein PR001_g28925 [Phytophthora rubi]
MPLPPQVRKELGLLKQVNTSTADINRYLSNKLAHNKRETYFNT